MAITNQVKLARAMRDLLLGDSRNALAHGSSPKPTFDAAAPGPVPLPRKTPEETGLSSVVLDAFYKQATRVSHANLHSLIVVHRGSVVGEGYFAPYRKDVWHVTHSMCKTLVGAAVGLAIEEGLFNLDDMIVSHFSREAGLLPSKNMRAITVRHLLTMSSGITFNEITEAVETSWIKGIFSSPVAFEPGSKFVYNSMNSYLLAALVCRKSGQGLMDFLTPRLLQPMGFGPIAWEKSPDGIEKGGWGLYMMPEDMAKFGQLYLQNGRWQTAKGERQLLPESWVKFALFHHIQSDGKLGYGGQCWVDADRSIYTMNGMFGQYVTLYPKQDMVVVMTAGNQRLFADSSMFDHVTEWLVNLPELPDSLVPAPAAHARLQHTLASLRFEHPIAAPEKPLTHLVAPRRRAQRWTAAHQLVIAALPSQLDAFCNQTWKFRRNKGAILPVVVQMMDNNFTTGVRAIYLETQKSHVNLMWEEAGGTLTLPIGFDRHLDSRIHIGAESFLLACRGQFAMAEDGEDVLVIEICLLEHSSHRILKLRRQDANLLLQLDEQPQFMQAVLAASAQGESTKATGSRQSSLAEMLTENDYFEYRLAQLCAPSLTGMPLANEMPEDEWPEE